MEPSSPKRGGLGRVASICLLVLGLAMGSLAASSTQPARADDAIYHSTTLSRYTSYGYGLFSAHKNNMTCYGGAPYAAKIFNKTSGGTVIYLTQGNCPLSYGTFGAIHSNWWCGNRTGFTQPGVCYITF